MALTATHLTLLGLSTGKRLEVISDGARWIGEGIAKIRKINEHGAVFQSHVDVSN